MGKMWSWVKEHVRPFVRLRPSGDFDAVYGSPQSNDKDEGLNDKLQDKIDDLEKRTEVGIWFKWKF